MSSAMKITAMGYWFPVDAPNFYRGEDEYSPDKPLIAQIHSTVAISRQSSEDKEDEKKKEDLQASVYQRLVTIAPYKDYTQAIPVFPRVRLGDVRNEPVMVVLTRDLFAQEWPASMKALVMIVHSRGLYLWLAVHDEIDETDTKAVRKALDDHIYDIVGGDFRSRAASHPDGDTDSSPPAPALGDDRTLQDYRQNHLGFLSFFQINAIFEALNNSAFNPAIFFERPQSAPVASEEVKVQRKAQQEDKYSLGEFIRSVTTLTAVGDDAPLSEEVQRKLRATDQPQRVFTTAKIVDKLLALTASATSVQNKLDIADQLRDDCLTSTVQHDLLRQFIRITSTNLLRVMKSRIERCSRVLLAEMLVISHRRQPLIQTAAPDYRDNIDGVNDAQLRSYIRYFASKMPLIKNIERSLKEALDEDDIKRDSIEGSSANSALFENLEALHAGWTQFVHGIDDDLQGLERAIAQARQDSLLLEEQRARTEQETAAEIKRLQEGVRQQSLEHTDQTVAILSNVLTLVTVIPIILFLFQNSSVQIVLFVWPPNDQTIAALGYLLLGLVVLFIIYYIFHRIVRWVLSGIERRRLAREQQRSERYYYEMDVQLDVPIDEAMAKRLLDEVKRPRTRWEKLASWLKEWWSVRPDHKPDLLDFNTHRTSYRGERASRDETVHKIYIATDVSWGGRGINPLRWRWRPKQSHDMRLFLIYEILFHRPSQERSFLLQSLRVVSPHGTVLTTEQLKGLKFLIVERFINDYIDTPLVVNGEHFDALLTLSEIPAREGKAPHASMTSPAS
jgi:hypothetical protein